MIDRTHSILKKLYMEIGSMTIEASPDELAIIELRALPLEDIRNMIIQEMSDEETEAVLLRLVKIEADNAQYRRTT